MIDIQLVLIFLTLAFIVQGLFTNKLWFAPAVSLMICLFFLLFYQGYPADTKLPDKIIVYGITSEAIWAGTEEEPTPRSYIFEVPDEWFEENDKRKGHAFKVERVEEVEGRDTDMSDSDNLDYSWKIVPIERIRK